MRTLALPSHPPPSKPPVSAFRQKNDSDLFGLGPEETGPKERSDEDKDGKLPSKEKKKKKKKGKEEEEKAPKNKSKHKKNKDKEEGKEDRRKKRKPPWSKEQKAADELEALGGHRKSLQCVWISPGSVIQLKSDTVHLEVIYALNTKNDEQESAIQALKDAHEEEIQQILAETREKILLYKSKVTEEVDLRRKIQVLEASLEDHVKMKQQALTEFEAFKHRVADMQLCAEAQHVQRIVTMSREVEEIRRKFEERLRSFGQLQVQFEKDKRLALEDLRTTHRREVQELLKSQQDHSASVNKGQEKAEELHRMEVEALNSTLDELRLEKKKLIEEYEGRLNKAQVFYERELDNLKRSQLFTAESLQASRDKEAELRKEFQGQEAVLRKTIGKLKTELQMVQDEASSLLDKCQKLQVALTAAESNVQVLQKQLDDAKEGETALLNKHKEVESELAAARERLQQQASDLVLKASHIGMLRATQMTQEVTIKDLESEKSRANERLCQLEEERAFLQSRTQSLDEEQKQQVLELEKKVNEAKRSQQEYYEMELKNLQNRLEGEVAQLNEAHSKTLEELAWKHHMAIEAVHSNASRDKKKLQVIGRLQDLVRKSEQGLGSAEGLIASLQDSQERLQSELDLTKGRLKETKEALLNVEAELEQERHQHEQTLAAMKEEEKLRVDRMAHDLEIKWTENLRQECSKLRQELRLQHEEDKKSAMSQLLQLKEREKTAARDSWQKKVEDLLNQVDYSLQPRTFASLALSGRLNKPTACQFTVDASDDDGDDDDGSDASDDDGDDDDGGDGDDGDDDND
ncbi:Protein FAM184A [Microtus ochrogaster]|uniref:Protein FAM184A n=1 Tax=Microtus ochrogaster TaxID=79684 RepID=A0A8J6L0H9_MICOH|nr:Protein FAM184A [Microtus ochrogaster]